MCWHMDRIHHRYHIVSIRKKQLAGCIVFGIFCGEKPAAAHSRGGSEGKNQSWFQLCQTFCTSSLSSRKSMSFCIFLRSPSSVRVTKVWGTISIWALAKV